MADLVNKNVAYHVMQIFAGFTPVIEDGAAIEEHHIGHCAAAVAPALPYRQALIKAQNIEGCFQFHFVAYGIIGKFLDQQHHTFGELLQGFR